MTTGDDCTHGDGCPVHPDVHNLHNFDHVEIRHWGQLVDDYVRRLDIAVPEMPPGEPVTVEGINDRLAAIAAAGARSTQSYRQALSAMGAHGASAVDVVAFALRWRLEQVPAPPPGALGNVFAPTVDEMATAVVAALRETGHVQ